MGIKEQHEKIAADVEAALSTGFFVANGVRYDILAPEAMSGDRYSHFQRLEIEVAYGITLQEIFQNGNKVIEQIDNIQRLGDVFPIREIIMNQQKSIINFQLQPNYTAIEIFCTVFCIKTDEDFFKYNSTNVEEKINNWRDGGYPIGFFHLLAANIMRGCRELLTITLREMNQLVESLDLQDTE
jgi:hypothetical protein